MFKGKLTERPVLASTHESLIFSNKTRPNVVDGIMDQDGGEVPYLDALVSQDILDGSFLISPNPDNEPEINQSRHEDETNVVNYVGIVTGYVLDSVLELDNSLLLYFTHFQSYNRGRSLRVGAKIFLHNVHPIYLNGKLLVRIHCFLA
jgi:hypothetical protein